MPTLNCPTHDTLLSFTRGDLPDDEIESVCDHLESCTGCEDTVARFEGQSDTFIGRLQAPAVKSRFADEPEFDLAVAAAKAVVGEPGVAPDAAAETVAAEDESLGRIGDYQLLAKLGHGGMGTVYRALHTRMRRVVALKVLATHRRHDPAVVERFAREIEAAGKLSHPNIVTAHDAGEEDGMHYLVMELVEGVDLHTLVSQHGPLPVADACEIIRQTALGLQHAHEHGLVHRDLKPSNLMLSSMASGGREPQGASRGSGAGKRDASSPAASAVPLTVSDMERQPPDNSPLASSSSNQPAHAGRSPVAQVKILDLGLALLLGDHVASEHITATGQVMGTLDYMAPEQADDSHGVDIRADIYSLGCTLFKLLTGRAPFSGKSFDTPAKKILAHAQTAPSSVREHREEVPEELAVVTDTMLAKDPDARPETPKDVAALLQPFCDGCDLAGLASQVHVVPERDLRVASADEIPVMLRRTGSARDRGKRTALGLLLAAAALLLMVTAAGIIIAIKRPGRRDTTIDAPDGSHVAIAPTGRVDVTLPADASTILLLPDDSASVPFSSRVDRYGDPLPLGAVARIGTERFRHGSRVDWLSFSADGKVVASSTGHAYLTPSGLARTRFWDIETGKMIGQIDAPARFMPDGKTLAISDEPVRLWDVHKGKQTATFDAPAGALLAPAGRTLIGKSRSTPGKYSIYDGPSARERHVFVRGRPYRFSPNGKLLAVIRSTAEPGTDELSMWDAEEATELWQQPVTGFFDVAVAFSGDGGTVAMLLQQPSVDESDDSPPTHFPAVIGVYDALTGKHILSLPRSNRVTCLAFAPDGNTLASAETTAITHKPIVQTWNVVANRAVRQYKTGDPGDPRSSRNIRSLAFSPDGRVLVAGTPSLLHVWDVRSGIKRMRDQEYRQAVTMLAVSADSKSLVTGGNSGAMRLWDLASGMELQELGVLAHRPYAVFSPDGRTLVAAEEEGARLYHSRDGRSFSTNWEPLVEDKNVNHLAISADGRRLSVLGSEVSVWQLPETKRLVQWELKAADQTATEEGSEEGSEAESEETGYFRLPVFSPDGKMVAALQRIGLAPDNWTPRFAMCYWDMETGQRLHTIPLSHLSLSADPLAFTSDSRVLIWSDWRYLRFHDVRAHRDVLKLEWNGGLHSAISPDLRLLATLHRGPRIRVWDFATGRKLLELAGHSGPVKSLAFSADGKFLVSGSDDTTALVWDLELARRELEQEFGRPDVGPPLEDIGGQGYTDFTSLWIDPPGAAPADSAMWSFVAGGPRAAAFLGEKLAGLIRGDESTNDPQVSADSQNDAPTDAAADLRRAERAIMALERMGDSKTKEVLETLAEPAANEGAETDVGRIGNPSRQIDTPSGRIDNPSDITRWSQQALARIARRSAEPTSPPEPPLAESPDRLDAHGDPLPPGAIARLGTQRLRQGSSVSDIVHLAGGRLLASTAGNNIRLWDTSTGQERLVLRGHQKRVEHLAALGDGKTLVSCDSHTVRYWNVGEIRSRIRQDFEPVDGPRSRSRQDVGPDGTEQNAGSNPTNAETLARSAATQPSGIHLRSLDVPGVSEKHEIWFFSHARDADVFVCGIRRMADDEREVAAFDSRTGKKLRTFAMAYSYDASVDLSDIMAMNIAPDGRRLAVSAAGGILDVWDVETGNRVHRLQEGGHSSWDVAYSPDDKWLVAGVGKKISWFNARTNQLVRTTDGGDTSAAATFAFSDSGLLASHNSLRREIRLWDVAAGKLRRSITTPDRCRTISLSPDGSNLAASTSWRIDRWNTDTGERLPLGGAHREKVVQVVFSPDGETAATVTKYAVRLWDAATGTLRKEIWLAGDQPQQYQLYTGPIAFTDDGDLVLCHQWKQIGLWDRDGQFQRSLYALDGTYVESMAVLPDQNRLALDLPSRATNTWGFSERTIVVLDIHTTETIHRFSCKPVHYRGPMCFLPNGETVFSPNLRAWDLTTGRRRFELPLSLRQGLATSPDSRALATLYAQPRGRADAAEPRRLRLWDLVTGQVIRDIEVSASTHHLAMSPDARIIATGLGDSTVRLWDATSGTELAVLEGHRGAIWSLDFSRDGRRLVSAGLDQTALVWDLNPHLRKLKPPAPIPDEPMLHRSWQALALQVPTRPAPLGPAPLATPQQQVAIERSIGQLDNEDVTVALTEAARLEAMGYLAVPALRSALHDAKSPTKRERIESVLAEFESPHYTPPERQTTARAIRVLESVATDHARSVLETLADGAPDAPRTKQARAVLERIRDKR